MLSNRLIALAFVVITLAPVPARADILFIPFFGVNFGGDSGKEFSDAFDSKQFNWGASLAFMGGGIFGFEGDFGFSPDFYGKTDVGGSSVLTATGNLIVGVSLGQDGRLWISHGFTEDGVRFSDTRAYDFAAGSWTDETPDGDQPVVRCLHACWLTADGDLALYAGQTTGVRALGDLWRLNDGSWTRLDEALPPERNLPAVARHGDDAVVFGGLGLDGDYLRDVYRIDGTTLAFEQLRPDGSRPPARAGSALIDDPGAKRLLLFGGTGSGNAFADTWELSLD